MLPQETIGRKRDGVALTAEEIAVFARGIADGTVSEGQAAAFAMAVTIRGMDAAETAALTLAMRDSGRLLDWSDLPGPVLDKHSTGGVGDKVSLILAPLLAACGCYVPMISGRGLGHTGGTLDKLESFTGYDVAPDEAKLRRVMTDAGCAIIAAGPELAPADARLYAVRDVTATVESTALITASILSKKLAAGIDRLVMDVKVGNGAFMKTADEARALADMLVSTAHQAGLPTRAFVTDMYRCLGHTAGNALEAGEAVAFLTRERCDARLSTLTRTLAASLLTAAGRDAGEAERAIDEALDSGAAAERFARMVAGLGGGDPFRAGTLPRAPVILDVVAERVGIVQAMDTRALGLVVVELGGGRRLPGEPIDPRVGLSEVAGPGDPVGPGRPLALIHATDHAAAEAAAARIRAAIRVGDTPPPSMPLIHTLR
ncbi:MAG: thymidine phosphorylase [Geminicoccaceae bacterium]|nr:thymidine phosphorylase [Geminicoccaceae bacterium]